MVFLSLLKYIYNPKIYKIILSSQILYFQQTLNYKKIFNFQSYQDIGINNFCIYQMSLKQKQDYLYREIIQSNQDPQKFQEFMQKRKGLDLQEYTLEELINLVQMYKGEIEQPQRKTMEMSELQQSVIEKHLPQELKPSLQENMENSNQYQKIAGEKGKSFNSSNKVYYQLVKKIQLPELYHRCYTKKQKIVVKIRSYSKNDQNSIFKSPYVVYMLQTPQCNWSVKRRFNDFLWLHLKLTQAYPGLPIPPIPKKTKMRSFDDGHLEQRMVIFQKFLNKLFNIPQICSDSIFEQFISISNQAQFDLCKQRYELKLHNRGKKLQFLNGTQTINMSQFAVDVNQYRFQKNTHEALQNINRLINQFQKSLSQTINLAYDLSSCLNKAYKHVSLNQNMRGSQTYEIIGDFFNEIGYNLDSQYFFIKNHMQSYWDYQQKYIGNLLENMNQLHRQQQEMLAKFKSVNNNEQNLKNEQIYEPTKQFNEYMSSKQLFRIKLSLLNGQIQRHYRQDYIQMAKEWSIAFQSYMGGVKQQMLSGIDQLTRALCVSQGKKLLQVEYLSNRRSQRASVRNQQ